MLTQSMHNQNRVLGAAMHGTSARIDVIMNNIANVDTPGFRAGNVSFESSLQNAVNTWRATGQLNLSQVRPTLGTQHGPFASRMDGNSVDMEFEMVQLYTQTVRYEVMVNSVLNNSRRLNTAITGR